jgi:hypothetical protein
MSTTPVANNEAEVTQNNDSTDLKTVSPKDTPDSASTESVGSSSSSTKVQTSGEDKKEDEMSMAYLCKVDQSCCIYHVHEISGSRSQTISPCHETSCETDKSLWWT